MDVAITVVVIEGSQKYLSEGHPGIEIIKAVVG